MNIPTKFSELTECPFCGGHIWHEKQKAKGYLIYRQTFEGKDPIARTAYSYDGLEIQRDGKVYCDDCGNLLGNSIENRVTKEVDRFLKEKELK